MILVPAVVRTSTIRTGGKRGATRAQIQTRSTKVSMGMGMSRRVYRLSFPAFPDNCPAGGSAVPCLSHPEESEHLSIWPRCSSTSAQGPWSLLGMLHDTTKRSGSPPRHLQLAIRSGGMPPSHIEVLPNIHETLLPKVKKKNAQL